jgi:hypothetical protein
MTGSKPKGQHFVPRFLLDGFASRRHRKESYGYLFRRGAPCHEVNIRDVGKSRYFHGDPSRAEPNLQRCSAIPSAGRLRWSSRPNVPRGRL